MSRENGRYLITDGTTYIGIDKSNRYRFDTCLRNAYGFAAECSARNFIAHSPKAVRDSLYVVDSLTMAKTPGGGSAGRRKRKIFSKTVREQVFRKNNGRCAICGQPLDMDFFSIDHIFPLERGGTDDLPNLQPACCLCNAAKSNQTHDEFIGRLWMWLAYNWKDILLFRLKRARRKRALHLTGGGGPQG